MRTLLASAALCTVLAWPPLPAQAQTAQDEGAALGSRVDANTAGITAQADQHDQDMGAVLDLISDQEARLADLEGRVAALEDGAAAEPEPEPEPEPDPAPEPNLSEGVHQGDIEIAEDGTDLIGVCDAEGKPLTIVEGRVLITASHVEVACIEARNGDNGFMIRGPGVVDVTIRDFVTRDTLSSGIGVWGVPFDAVPPDYDWAGVRDVTILRGEVINACDGGFQEKITIANGVDGFEIAGVWMYDTRTLDTSHGGEGIDLKEGVSNGRVHHNDLGPVSRSDTIYIDGGNGRLAHEAPHTFNIEIDHNRVRDEWGVVMVSTEGRGSVDGVHVHHNDVVSAGHLGIIVYEHPDAPSRAEAVGGTVGHISNVTVEQNRSRGPHGDMQANNPTATGIVFRNNNGNLHVRRRPPGLVDENNSRDVSVDLSGIGPEGLAAETETAAE